MKIALSSWNNRIAPVFDVSRTVLVLEIVDKHILAEEEFVLPDGNLSAKIMKLVQLDVDTLICGAISRPLAGMAIAHGIRVISFVAGEVKDIITACLNDDLPNPAFAMPGCCGRQMRFELERYSIKKNETELTNETERERSDIMPKSNGRGPQSKDPESGSGRRPCGTATCKRTPGIGKGRSGEQRKIKRKNE